MGHFQLFQPLRRIGQDQATGPMQAAAFSITLERLLASTFQSVQIACSAWVITVNSLI
jgi:hypothetical protein